MPSAWWRFVAEHRSRRWGCRLLFLVAAVLSACGGGVEATRGACVQAALRQPGLINGVAAYSEEGGRIAAVSVGFKGGFRLRSKHRFHAASLTKPRVAHAIKVLADRGVIGLDSTVASNLPEHLFVGSGTRQVTVRELLQHTGGLGRADGLDALWYRAHDQERADCALAARYVLTLPTKGVPGERTEYSNAGYCLLAEILLRHADNPAVADLAPVLRSPYGGAGGWVATLTEIHRGLGETLPLQQLPAPPQTLPDGSWYSYGWRYWPQPLAGASWTHTGRLPGFLAVALTDGERELLVAHFEGDPPDYHAAAERFGRQAWRCMTQ